MNKNLKFILLQITFFTLFCTIYVFANPIMKSNGFGIEKIGFVLSMSAIISIFIQYLIAKLINSFQSITNKRVVLISMLTILISNLIISATSNTKIIEILTITTITTILTSQTFVYALIFDYINNGIEIDFGLTRGMGSLAFAITSITIGYLAKIYGYGFIKYINFIFITFSILIILTLNSKLLKKEINKNEKNNLTLLEFYKKYKKFSYILVGVLLILTGHMGFASFLIDVSNAVGQGPFFVGILFFIGAFLELPVMGYFNKLKNKFGNNNLFYISAIAFTMKAAVILIGLLLNSYKIVFLAHFIQIFGFAMYMPAVLYYINHTIDKKDRITAQAYLGVFTTTGSILAGFISSKALFYGNASIMALILTLISFIGTLFIINNIEKEKN